MTPDSNELLARVEAGAKPDALREMSVKALVSALEGSAANTDTDPRWVAASALRNLTNWEGRTIALSAPVPSPGGAAEASAEPECEPFRIESELDPEGFIVGMRFVPASPSDDVRSALAGIVSECQRWRDEQPSSDGASKGWAQHIQGIAEAALRSAPVYGPATVSEPVAWRIRFPDGGCSQWFDGKPPKYYGSYEMAYASPQHVDREATVSARDAMIEDAVAVLEALRAHAKRVRDKKSSSKQNSVSKGHGTRVNRVMVLGQAIAAIRSLASGAKP